jgi:hypothetical protein
MAKASRRGVDFAGVIVPRDARHRGGGDTVWAAGHGEAASDSLFELLAKSRELQSHFQNFPPQLRHFDFELGNPITAC